MLLPFKHTDRSNRAEKHTHELFICQSDCYFLLSQADSCLFCQVDNIYIFISIIFENILFQTLITLNWSKYTRRSVGGLRKCMRTGYIKLSLSTHWGSVMYRLVYLYWLIFKSLPTDVLHRGDSSLIYFLNHKKYCTYILEE